MEHYNLEENFISAFFEKLNKKEVTYCVLRNYQNLPKNKSRDIDMYVKNSDKMLMEKIIIKTAKEFSWKIIHHPNFVRERGEGGFIVYKEYKNKLKAVRIEYSSIFTWKRILLLDEKIMAKGILIHKNGFYIPSPGAEAALLLLKGIIIKGRVIDKYKKRITSEILKEPDVFKNLIISSFGHNTAEDILKLTQEGEWEKLNKKSFFLGLN
jgi:hypothetical protein